MGRVSDWHGERETLYRWLPAARGVGEIHGDFQGAQGKFLSNFLSLAVFLLTLYLTLVWVG